MNEYTGYPLFNDVRSTVLRNWNRLNIIYNIKELLKNNSLSVKYFKQFSKNDQVHIYGLAARVQTEGYENVRRSIIRKLASR